MFQSHHPCVAKMTVCSFCLFLMVALFSMCYTHSVSWTEADETAGSMQTAKTVMDNVLDGISTNQWSIPASSLWDEGNTEGLIFTDLGRQGDPRDASLRTSRPRLFTSSKFQEADNGEPEQARDKERRDTGEVLSVGGGDFDVLRCMVGQVYRPCWQA
nr:pro-MCH [Paramormyrops kingsleyae]